MPADDVRQAFDAYVQERDDQEAEALKQAKQDLANANAENKDLIDRLGAADDKVAEQAQKIKDLEAEVKRLEDELGEDPDPDPEPEPEPEPEKPKVPKVIGQSMEYVAPNVKKVDAMAAYFQPGDFSSSAKQILWSSTGDNTMKRVQQGISLGCKVFWFSFKDGKTAQEAEKIEKFLASCPKDKGYTYLVTFFHEHNQNILDGSLSLADYKKGSKYVADAAHKHGMLYGPNHNGSRKNPKTGKWGYWPEVWASQEADTSLYDFWGVDGYLPEYQNPNTLFKPAVDYAKSLGKPLCWRESGAPADDLAKQAVCGGQLREFYDKNVNTGLWWSSQVSGTGTINYRMQSGTAKTFYKIA